MNWTRAQLKSNAKLMVKKNWIMCVIVSLVMIMVAGHSGSGFNMSTSGGDPGSMEMNQESISAFFTQFGGQWAYYINRFAPILAGTMISISLIALLLKIFLGNPLVVGGARFYLHNIHSQGVLDDLAFAFRNMFSNVVKVMLFRDIYIFLWSLLLIVPGILKSYSWRLVPYLLADNPELDTREALDLSAEMMQGERWNAFVLDISFILWDIASALTFGILGILWVNPYEDATNAELYTALKVKGNIDL